MINLSKLKNPEENKNPEVVKEKEVELVQETLGIEEPSKLKTIYFSGRRKIHKLGTEAKYLGIYNNIWLLNIVFLNLSIAFILFYLVSSSYDILPERIGVNLDNISGYDTMIHKSFIYSPLFLHLGFVVVALYFAIRYQKRLNHLFIIAFFNLIVLSVFEISGIYHLIKYFS